MKRTIATTLLVSLLIASVFAAPALAQDVVPVESVFSGLVTEGPVDVAQYTVGPGDVFVIAVLGQIQKSWTVPVSPEGTVVIPPAGEIPVATLSLGEAKKEILRELSHYYRGSQIQITLTELRRFEVHVLGQVEAPGTYIVTALTRVSSAVEMAGGFLEEGSRRRVTLRGLDGETEYADVLRFEMLGEREWNPFVSDGDIVYVPVKIREATVHGSVALPGRYEIVEGETLIDFIRIAGGFDDDAIVDSVEVRRFMRDEPSRTRRFFVDFSVDPPRSEERDLRIHAGDEIFVRGIPQWHLQRAVTVTGEVLYPGVYVIDEGRERLSDLVARAGGFTEDADLIEASLTRRSFRSEAEDREFERLRTMPVADMTDDEYAYFKMRSREKKEEVVVDFVALFRGDDEEEDILLRRGDIVNVPQVSKTVTVSGQVVNPGRLPFMEGEDYRYYVERAGGYAKRASKGEIRIIKGSTGIWFDRGETDLEPGDTIWIPEKPERDYWALFKDFMTVAAQIATVYIVVDRASN